MVLTPEEWTLIAVSLTSSPEVTKQYVVQNFSQSSPPTSPPMYVQQSGGHYASPSPPSELYAKPSPSAGYQTVPSPPGANSGAASPPGGPYFGSPAPGGQYFPSSPRTGLVRLASGEYRQVPMTQDTQYVQHRDQMSYAPSPGSHTQTPPLAHTYSQDHNMPMNRVPSQGQYPQTPPLVQVYSQEHHLQVNRVASQGQYPQTPPVSYGYAHQQAIQQQPGSMGGNNVHVVAPATLAATPAPVQCPSCGVRGSTATTFIAGNTTHAWAAGLCICLGVGCIPYLMSSMKDVEHRCSACGVHLATWHRSGRTDVHMH